jgi:lipopolysaccharide/colanic/teichoic acid biosynthesis glycosyltransferase
MMARTVDIERRARADAAPPTPSPPRPNPRALLLKHALDRVIALGGLLVMAPVIAGVALGLRLRGGPVLRREDRIGFGGRPVLVRSFAITDEMCDSAIWRVLARVGVTTLPQLWSVARGQMSIVGPRPREPGFEAPPARPGLTGLAQLEQLDRWLSVAEQLELDERYARTWSLGLDARIVWRTLSSGGGPARPRR